MRWLFKVRPISPTSYLTWPSERELLKKADDVSIYRHTPQKVTFWNRDSFQFSIISIFISTVIERLLFVFEPVCNVNLLSKQHSNWIILTSAQHCWKNLCTLRFEKLNMATECGWYCSYWFTNCKDVQTQSTDVMQCNMVVLHVQQLLHPNWVCCTQ